MLQFVEVETSKRGRVTTVSMDGYTNKKTLLGVVHEVGREVAKYDENEGRGLLNVKTEREAKECFQKNTLDPETYCFELEEVECASYFDEKTDDVVYGEAATYYFYIRFFIWDEVEEEKPEELEKVAAVVEKTVHGYTVEQYIIGAFDTPIALIDRHLNFCSWVVAWNYDKDSDTWGQGHYFDDKAAAVAYFKTYMN